jgi:hypothetical protein
MGDLWGSRVVVTTSRGSGNTLAMAEYALAGILRFAKGLHRATVDRGTACSTIAHIDRCYWKARLRASLAPAELGSMSVNSGDDPSLRQGPLCSDEAGGRAHQRRPG